MKSVTGDGIQERPGKKVRKVQMVNMVFTHHGRLLELSVKLRKNELFLGLHVAAFLISCKPLPNVKINRNGTMMHTTVAMP